MKNKIHNYDFLVIGAGLIGSLTAISLLRNNYKVLVIDKYKQNYKDNRTLAVNANSKDFLTNLGLWKKLKVRPEPINKIEITDTINKSPLIFENINEEMGNVILNKDLLAEAKQILLKENILIEETIIEISNIKPNEKIKIKKKYFLFKKIILCLGKKYDNETIIKKFSIPSLHKSYVGFFDHSNVHNQTAYEIFTSDGPIAVLPAPGRLKKTSTFIYSTKNYLSNFNIQKLIKNHFSKTHGLINFKKDIYQYEILPHLSKGKLNQFILIGDILRSIHPVAGQGWNLGIKDIQTLVSLLKQYSIDEPDLIDKYYNQRSLESFTYLTFTSLINKIYENQNLLNYAIIKSGFGILKKSSFLKNTFVKQAMGRLNLV
tara:strand:+ start:2572 stop:3693 length:1122 start_codon:yes stop_codon:yes gene_type:complete